MSDETIGYAAVGQNGDTLEIVPAPGVGMFMVRATCGEHVATHLMPRGFETWSREEIQAHISRFVAPALKTKIERLAAGVDKPEPVTKADVIRLEAAREKREMRAAKLAALERKTNFGGEDEPA